MWILILPICILVARFFFALDYDVQPKLDPEPTFLLSDTSADTDSDYMCLLHLNIRSNRNNRAPLFSDIVSVLRRDFSLAFKRTTYIHRHSIIVVDLSEKSQLTPSTEHQCP